MPIWDDLSPYVSNKNSDQAGPLSLLRLATRAQGAAVGLEIHPSHDKAATASLESNVTWEGIAATELSEMTSLRVRYEDAHFDVVFVNHAQERVINPLALLSEVYRVLKPGGRMVSTTTNIRPNENDVYFSITPAGFVRMARNAGFNIRELRPGIDGRTLFERIYAGNPRESGKYFSEESPLNQEIEEKLKSEAKNVRSVNIKKLQFCGEYHAICERPQE